MLGGILKVVLNRVTNFEGATLHPGDVINIPLNVSQRWINAGLAHEFKEVKVDIPEEIVFREPDVKPKVKKPRKKRTKKVNDTSYTQ
jgi:hypothetical protein